MLCDNLPQRMPNMPTGEHSRTSEKDVRRYLVLVVNFIQWGLKMLKLKQFCKAIVSNSCRAKFGTVAPRIVSETTFYLSC